MIKYRRTLTYILLISREWYQLEFNAFTLRLNPGSGVESEYNEFNLTCGGVEVYNMEAYAWFYFIRMFNFLICN